MMAMEANTTNYYYNKTIFSKMMAIEANTTNYYYNKTTL
jgi:hypothetical protein